MGPFKRWQRQRILRQAALDDETWRRVARQFSFVERLDDEEKSRLREMTVLFLNEKRIHGAAGLELTDEMRVGIAIQACVLIVNLDLDYYKGWVEIIVYPDEFVPEREHMDEAGVVHVTRQPLAGEAWLQGPVILSYADVVKSGDDGVNVIIHEFAHKLDMLNGGANGYPPLHKGMSREIWSRVFEAAFKDFSARVERGEETAIDPYAAENPGEFFAVLSEVFFETPEVVQGSYPEVYQQLCLFYRQDPITKEELWRR
ncbi:MAG: zinc-dependent peptidase [Burkholderiales bacterium]